MTESGSEHGGVASDAQSMSERLPSTPCLVRIRQGNSTGLCLWDGTRLLDLSRFRSGELAGLDRLLTLELATAREALEAALRAGLPEIDPAQSPRLAPVESQEVWGAGVTYYRSRQARMDEAVAKDVYSRIYDASRPELFFKAAGWRVVGDGGMIGIRADSTWTVPEPELAVLANASAEVVGYACGNDMSSRSIEAENPLYLPQAKIYRDSCSVGPAIALAWYVDCTERTIDLRISREQRTVYQGESNTRQLTRDPGKLVQVLYSCYELPYGAWLLTGTPLVPPDSYSAANGDVIEISIEAIGKLTNRAHIVAHSGAEAPPLTMAAD
jgi:2-dehydro-3-deoxy-D-arabinonate dehydratase